MAAAPGNQEVAGWLEAVGAGLGVHAHVFEGYGAASIADLGTLDNDDLVALCAMLRESGREVGLPKELQIKWIAKALRGEIERQKAGAFITRAAAPAREAALSSDDIHRHEQAISSEEEDE